MRKLLIIPVALILIFITLRWVVPGFQHYSTSRDAGITDITDGMTKTEYINAINANLAIFDDLREGNLTTALTGNSGMVSTMNTNFTAIGTSFGVTGLLTLYWYDSGATVRSKINSNFDLCYLNIDSYLPTEDLVGNYFYPTSAADFNADTTEVVDSAGVNNLTMVESSCWANNSSTSRKIRFPVDLDIDADFKITMHVQYIGALGSEYDTKFINFMSGSSATGNGFHLSTYSSVSFAYTNLYVRGSTKAVTRTAIAKSLHSRTVPTKVTIERVGDDLFISYNDSLQNTVALAAYGEIGDTTQIQICSQYTMIYDVQAWQGATKVLEAPFSEGYITNQYGKITPIFNKVGVDGAPMVAMTSYSPTVPIRTQDYFHFNLKNGFSLYQMWNVTQKRNIYLRIPYKNGLPQTKVNNYMYSTTYLYFVGNYPPGFSDGVETKLKMKTNYASLTDTSIYVNAALAPKPFKWAQIYPSDSKVFSNMRDSINPYIAVYSSTQSVSNKILINNIIPADTVELWIWAGQSNAQARDTLSQLDTIYKPNKIWVQCWDSTSANRNFDTYSVITNSMAQSRGVAVANLGKYPAAAPFSVLRSNKNRRVYHYNAAVSGTYLGTTGSDSTNCWNINLAGNLYNDMKRELSQYVFTRLAREDVPYKIKGFVWMQGEADCVNEANSLAYKQNLKDLINDFRTFTGRPTLPVYIMKTGQLTTATYEDNVRAAQVAIPSELTNCYTIDCDAFGWEDNTKVHLNKNGRVSFANALLNNIIE